jgi:hypothetical protein
MKLGKCWMEAVRLEVQGVNPDEYLFGEDGPE